MTAFAQAATGTMDMIIRIFSRLSSTCIPRSYLPVKTHFRYFTILTSRIFLDLFWYEHSVCSVVICAAFQTFFRHRENR